MVPSLMLDFLFATVEEAAIRKVKIAKRPSPYRDINEPMWRLALAMSLGNKVGTVKRYITRIFYTKTAGICQEGTHVWSCRHAAKFRHYRFLSTIYTIIMGFLKGCMLLSDPVPHAGQCYEMVSSRMVRTKPYKPSISKLYHNDSPY